ncbi:MAG: hypothetical protein QOJ53_754 [Sphingomonadales bacterium]|jgi:hypothetical protein|nr:hypothetical protein [Sphingomonadales bacterium]
MTRRIDVRIDRIVVDGAGPVDRAALAAGIGRELAKRLAAPGAADGLASRNVASVDGGNAVAGGNGVGIANAIAGAIGAGSAR